jgi:hypothetical protein
VFDIKFFGAGEVELCLQLGSMGKTLPYVTTYKRGSTRARVEVGGAPRTHRSSDYACAAYRNNGPVGWTCAGGLELAVTH